jgi:hypothetical protein
MPSLPELYMEISQAFEKDTKEAVQVINMFGQTCGGPVENTKKAGPEMMIKLARAIGTLNVCTGMHHTLRT